MLVLALLTLTVGASLSPRGQRGSVAAARIADASSDALAAALDLFDGVSVSDCLNNNNPDRRDCVTLESAPEDLARGIAVFGISDAGQNGGFGAAMGRTASGDWKLWFTSQNPYQLTRLPGEMVVCAGGDGLRIHSGPSAEADVPCGLADGALVTGEQFVLTEPVDPGHSGFGWFRISEPQTGWLYSKYLESAALNDHCALHDAQVGGS
jgi:hypothetical protein